MMVPPLTVYKPSDLLSRMGKLRKAGAVATDLLYVCYQCRVSWVSAYQCRQARLPSQILVR